MSDKNIKPNFCIDRQAGVCIAWCYENDMGWDFNCMEYNGKNIGMCLLFEPLFVMNNGFNSVELSSFVVLHIKNSLTITVSNYNFIQCSYVCFLYNRRADNHFYMTLCVAYKDDKNSPRYICLAVANVIIARKVWLFWQRSRNDLCIQRIKEQLLYAPGNWKGL